MKSEHGFKGLLDYTDSFLGISDSEYDFIGLPPRFANTLQAQSLRESEFESIEFHKR
jgi:hypothetical protein